jgi:excisionase family DNA binding protein
MVIQALKQRFSRHDKQKYNQAMPKGWITIKKAAELLGLEPHQIRDMIRAGHIPDADLEKVGNAWLIREKRALTLRPHKVGRPHITKV